MRRLIAGRHRLYRMLNYMHLWAMPSFLIILIKLFSDYSLINLPVRFPVLKVVAGSKSSGGVMCTIMYRFVSANRFNLLLHTF